MAATGRQPQGAGVSCINIAAAYPCGSDSIPLSLSRGEFYLKAKSMEIVEKSEAYKNLMNEVIEEHEDLHWIRNADVSICVLQSDREKRAAGGRIVYGECMKVKPVYKPFCPYDFLIVVYEPNIEGFTDHQLRILMYHELLHVGIDETGEELKYVVNPHDIEDFRTVIDQYGLDWNRLTSPGEDRRQKCVTDPVDENS